jgi:hypothetical protein
MDRLRTIPTRQSLELRAEVSEIALCVKTLSPSIIKSYFQLRMCFSNFQVASMASDLKKQRYVLEERVNQISEYGVRV